MNSVFSIYDKYYSDNLCLFSNKSSNKLKEIALNCLFKGEEYYEKGMFTEALDYFKNSEKLGHKSNRLYLGMGEIYEKWGDLNKAIENYNKVDGTYFDIGKIRIQRIIGQDPDINPPWDVHDV